MVIKCNNHSVGDQTLEINGFDAYNMEHSEAIKRIKSGGNIVSLLVRRTGLPPPSITDIIAATNSVAASSSQAHSPISGNGRIINQPMLTPQQQQQLGYNQSDSTLLRPKSPFINDYTLAQQQYQQNLYNQQQQQQQYYYQQQQQQQQQSRLYNSSSVLTNRNF